MSCLDMTMHVLGSSQTPVLANYPARGQRKMSRAPTWILSFNRNNNKNLERASRLSVDVEDPVVKERERILSFSNETLRNDEEYREYVEMQRRRKIGLANKGKVPWNKGKRHSEETLELISKRTIEALRNPKIKSKMSKYPRFHSAENKAKIGFAMKRLWEERLKQKKLKEKCYLAWTAAISEAAKLGGHGQQELEWDSYERMKTDIELLDIQQKAEKAKEFAELKAKRAAEVRVTKMARLAEKRKEKEQKLLARESKRDIKKPVDQKELLGFSHLKLKNQMMKVDASALSCHNDVQKWDLEFVKKEKLRKSVSFADQIRAAKNRQPEKNENKF